MKREETNRSHLSIPNQPYLQTGSNIVDLRIESTTYDLNWLNKKGMIDKLNDELEKYNLKVVKL